MHASQAVTEEVGLNTSLRTMHHLAQPGVPRHVLQLAALTPGHDDSGRAWPTGGKYDNRELRGRDKRSESVVYHLTCNEI